jgi:hypothetical protein
MECLTKAAGGQEGGGRQEIKHIPSAFRKNVNNIQADYAQKWRDVTNIFCDSPLNLARKCKFCLLAAILNSDVTNYTVAGGKL